MYKKNTMVCMIFFIILFTENDEYNDRLVKPLWKNKSQVQLLLHCLL